jgi:hypothetical protein
MEERVQLSRETSEAATDAAAPAATVPLARAPVTAAEVLQLQRAAGNAAVGRYLAGSAPRTLSRQPGTMHPALKDTYYYGSGAFKGRYDGIVERGAGRITLLMRVEFELAPEFVDRRTSQFSEHTLKYYKEFQQKFKEVVERIWSGAHALKPALPLDKNYYYDTRVRVVVTDSDPHATIRLYPKTIDASTGEAARSCAKAATPGEKGIALLQEGDNVEKERVMEYKGEKLYFYGNTSAHEFGHLLGLGHVNEKAPLRKKPSGEWTDEDKYGVTPEQAADIMGRGNMVGPQNMGPFIRIAEEYGKEVAPSKPEWNKWTVVPPGGA